MVERVERGVRRAQFDCEVLGPMTDAARAARASLERGLATLEALGLSPVLDDGAVAGNGSVRLANGSLWVSASGRLQCAPRVVEVVDVRFDPFTVRFRRDDESEPTSDVALYWAALVQHRSQDGLPRAALHGHALDTEDDARRLGLPISERAMTFGTPAEHASMRAMLDAFPYPAHDAWIRRAHGFFVAGPDMPAVIERARSLVRA